MTLFQYFALCLCAFGLVLLVWHVLSWLRLRRSGAPAEEWVFIRRQLIRRLQASSLIVLLGVAIIAADRVPEGMPSIWYWSAVMLIVFWMGVLALADILAIQAHHDEHEMAQLRERHPLEQEVGKLAGAHENTERAGALPHLPNKNQDAKAE